MYHNRHTQMCGRHSRIIGLEISLYCVLMTGEGVPESVLYNAFCSDSASIFQQFTGMTAPKRVEKRVKFHIHKLLTCRIYLNHDTDCDHFACQFLVRSFFGGGWSKNMIFA